jgi:tetratricopeptide (TPR) repeat protein
MEISAAQSYAESRAAFAKGDHAAALFAIRAAIASDARFPNAHNFAGWVLLHMPSRTPAQLDDAIAHFRAAIDVDSDDPMAMTNLCDALLAAGRDADAIAEAEQATAPTHDWKRMAAAHNWLGWRLMNQAETLERSIDHLRKAVHWRTWWGVARMNLGKALELAHRGEDAYEELATALRCDDDFDRAFCHERIGAYQARHGWLRNALDSLRTALREDAKRGGARQAPYLGGITWLEQQLRAAGIEPPPPEAKVGVAWARARELEIPAGFLARDEFGEPLADEVIEVERLVRAERWADVVAQLQKLDGNARFDAVGYAEEGAKRARRAGHRTEAFAIMELVVDAYRGYASGATSGGEGMARMAEVAQAQARLVALDDLPETE